MGRPRLHDGPDYAKWRRAYNLVALARHRAKKFDRPFDLTVEFIFSQFPKGCARTGIPFEFGKNGRTFRDRSPWCPSLDKINPDGGYTQDNVQVVCWWYNAAKARFTDAEVLDLCRRTVSFSDMQAAKIVEVRTD